MKYGNKILVGLMAIAGLTSCVSEDIKSGAAHTETGRMVLGVSVKEPESVTRAQTEVFDFPVAVESVDGSYKSTYKDVASVPAEVELPVGDYVVTSHSNLELKKSMSVPYYQGSEPMTITNGVTTDVDVVCKMLNSHISVNYGDDFLNAFKAWTITVDDGSTTGIYFDNNSVNDYYWFFEDDVERLKVNFSGVLESDNSTITYSSTLRKSSDTMEQYGDDSRYFRGGDAVVINFAVKPEETQTGTITAITINAYTTFAESEEEVELEVADAESTGGEPGNDPKPGSDLITLDLPNDMTVAADTDPELGNTLIKCEKGIKSIKVNIESSSDEMMESLSDLNDNYGVDFVTGAEIVENNDVVTLFEDLGQELAVPNGGDTEYTFPIGNFFGLLIYLSGEHTFHLVVEDMEGNQKTGVLVLTVE